MTKPFRLPPELVAAIKANPTYRALRDEYRSPRTYPQWNDLLVRTIMISGEPFDRSLIEHVTTKDPYLKISMILANAALQRRAAIRYLTAELGEAFLATTLGIKMDVPPTPYPVLQVMLPAGLIVDRHGNSILRIIISDNRLLLEPVTIGGSGVVLQRRQPLGPGLIIDAMGECGTNYGGSFLWDGEDWGSRPLIMLSPLHAGEEAENVTDINKKVINVAVNTWLTLGYNRAMESTGDIPACSGSLKGFGATGRKIPMAPTYIGWGYRRQTRSLAPRPGAPRQSATRRPHWRCGHWHTVRHGSGRQERRVQWFQPVYVGLQP